MASALGGGSHRGHDGRGAFGQRPARAGGSGGADIRRGETGSVSGSYIVTLKGYAGSVVGGAAVARRYGARISHTYGAALNGFAVRADVRRARRLAADPRVASVVQDTRVTFDGVRVAGAASGRVQRNPPSWGLDRIDQADRPLDGRYTAPGSAGSG